MNRIDIYSCIFCMGYLLLLLLAENAGVFDEPEVDLVAAYGSVDRVTEPTVGALQAFLEGPQ